MIRYSNKTILLFLTIHLLIYNFFTTPLFADDLNIEPVAFHYFQEGSPADMIIQDGYGYFATGSHGLQILDLRDLDNMVNVGSFDPGPHFEKLILDYPRLFVRDFYDDWWVFDVSDPANPQHLATWQNIASLVVQDTLAYFFPYPEASQPCSLHVASISQFDTLTDISVLPFGLGVPTEFHMIDSTLIIHYSPGFKIVDVRSPESPVFGNDYELYREMAYPVFRTEGNRLYFRYTDDWSNSYGVIMVFELDDSLTLTCLGERTLRAAESKFVVHNGYVFTSYDYQNYRRGIRALDANNATAIVSTGSYQLGRNPWCLAWGGDHLYVIDNSFLQVFDCTNALDTPDGSQAPPAGFTLSNAWPNPFNGSARITLTVPTSGHVALYLYDVLGRPVAFIQESVLDIGQHTFTFDASMLPSGPYFIRAEGPGDRAACKKVVLIR